MARESERGVVTARRIIACFAPGSAVAPEVIARRAIAMQAELTGLFIEDTQLLRFAALPFATEVGRASALARTVDVPGIERALRHQADFLRRALAAALDPGAHAWSFRVARGEPADAVAAALAESYASSLLLPPGVHPHGEQRIVRATQIDPEWVRALLAGARPVLILPA